MFIGILWQVDKSQLVGSPPKCTNRTKRPPIVDLRINCANQVRLMPVMELMEEDVL